MFKADFAKISGALGPHKSYVQAQRERANPKMENIVKHVRRAQVFHTRTGMFTYNNEKKL